MYILFISIICIEHVQHLRHNWDRNGPYLCSRPLSMEEMHTMGRQNNSIRNSLIKSSLQSHIAL